MGCPCLGSLTRTTGHFLEGHLKLELVDCCLEEVVKEVSTVFAGSFSAKEENASPADRCTHFDAFGRAVAGCQPQPLSASEEECVLKDLILEDVNAPEEEKILIVHGHQ